MKYEKERKRKKNIEKWKKKIRKAKER